MGNNSGTISGSPKTVEGKIKEALEFNGVSDFIDCGNDESLNLTKAITISIRMKAEG